MEELEKSRLGAVSIHQSNCLELVRLGVLDI